MVRLAIPLAALLLAMPAPTTAAATRPTPLRGTTWLLRAIAGQPPAATSTPQAPISLQLLNDQPRLVGHGGCNRLMGGFQLQGSRLSFSPLASTRMACAPEVMALEQRFSQSLEQVRRWSVLGGTLRLDDGRSRTLLLFEASAPPR
jgi:heat shock protein HslJ